MAAHISSILWANTVLKLQDAVLSKVKPNLTFIAPVNNAQQLFLFDFVIKAGERSSLAVPYMIWSFRNWFLLKSNHPGLQEDLCFSHWVLGLDL